MLAGLCVMVPLSLWAVVVSETTDAEWQRRNPVGASAMGSCAPHGSWGETPPIVLSIGSLTGSADAYRYFKLHTEARLERVEVGLQSTTSTSNVLTITAKLPGASSYAVTVVNAYDLDTDGASADGVIEATLADKKRIFPRGTTFKVLVDSGTAVANANVVLFFKPLA